METIEQERGVMIEPPNLGKLNPWLKKYIQTPFISFADKTHRSGKPFTIPEQIAATRKQVTMFVRGLQEANIPDEEIRAELTSLVSKME